MIGRLFACLVFVSGAAVAVPGPALPIPDAPTGVYRDADPSASADPRRSRGTLAAIEQRLATEIARRPEDFRLRAQLGFARSLHGVAQASDAAFADALALAGTNMDARRHVLWSWGWALLNRDEPRGALNAWTEAAQLHGGAPFWVPYSYAVALWRLGERDAAVRWYEAASMSFPLAWGTRDAMRRKTAHWRERERATIESVYGAWAITSRSAH